MNAELHFDPSLGHRQKGSAVMKQTEPHKIREMRIEIHRGPKQEVTGHTVHHHMIPKATKSPAFSENTSESYPFGADGHSSTHGHMLDHIAEHLGLAAAATKGVAAEEEEEGE